ncbi:nickel/cobalt efflux protein RcnA [Kosakonia sacchari]|uniref:Nickel/cobalt efflux system n=1 Tax=Kosakonia sacchari TaxID=1158459 RepID=A0A1G4YRS4_9ENTR|nr:nickel/cobalt efflux protein RcnA [Kosakonia sacchari]AHJ77075.1 nickel/cobalt efflux protein RcnA [Kosakonia sacchari SP1]ANR80500.1 nickel/cobalt efflux protein RcnA [Kosakonia sacchari]MDN2485693.1 nickel/cobalt efflux protein RcnA [Kosakonia sacchari]NUL37118.1 nickel/cobalt efflux protein RcnA [Kosakonia sacchari]SCX56132.1 nickel/cobalt exporter [Kosakonia sacchari]
MNDFTTLFQQGNAWFFIPSAILLGALHGLEPGHSKTMMAAFIIAIKGTVKQAVMLGLAATLSHTVVVWLIALGGMYLSNQFTAQAVEPWLQMVSAVIIFGTAVWMFLRTWQGERSWLAGHHHHHAHDHSHAHRAPSLVLQPVTHARVTAQPTILSLRKVTKEEEYQDAHERAHARDIERRFTGSEVTNGQILLFGLTGGLIPCPAAITILLICIQLKAITLGATLVVSFSIGLALTLVAVGVGAAISVQQAAKRWSGFNTLARKAPYFSSALIALVGIYMGIHGYRALQ